MRYLARAVAAAVAIGTVVFFVQGSNQLQSVQRDEAQRKNPVKEIETITLADALLFYHSADNIFIDARTKNYYDYAHITQAINITPSNLETNAVSIETFKKLKAAPNIVVYDISAQAGNARQVVQMLSGKGIENAKIYLDGWTQWKACKLPTESTAATKLSPVLERKELSR